MLQAVTRFLICGAIHLAVGAYFVPLAQAGDRLSSDRPAVDETCARRQGPVAGPFVPVAIPRWRDRYLGMTVLARRSAGGTPSPTLRITSSVGLAGIDQNVLVRHRSLTVVVHGRVRTGKALLVVGWTQGSRVSERVRDLRLARGREAHVFRLSRNAAPLTVTVGVLQLRRRGILELDRIELQSRGRQLLRNPGLRPALCRPPPTGNLEETCLRHRPASDLPQLARVVVPGWRDRYERMNLLARPTETVSAPLHITSAYGLAGIDQVVRVPRMPLKVTIRGRVASGRARLILSWNEAGGVHEAVRAVRLGGGSETRRFRLPAGKGALWVTVGVAQLVRDGVLELDSVELESSGRQFLRNPALWSDVCPPVSQRPKAAFATPRWLRWAATLALLALVAVAIQRGASMRSKR